MTLFARVRNGIAPDDITGLGGVTEGDIRGSTTDLISSSGGVVNLSGGHLLVHQRTVAAMFVRIDPGIGYVPNNSFNELDSDSVKFWEVVSDNTEELAIGANSSGSTRIDKICLYLNPSTTPNEFGSNIATMVVVAGTPGAGAPATPANHLALANVTVVNGASTIANSAIVDLRTQVVIKSAFRPLDNNEVTGQKLSLGNVFGESNKQLLNYVIRVPSSSTPDFVWTDTTWSTKSLESIVGSEAIRVKLRVEFGATAAGRAHFVKAGTFTNGVTTGNSMSDARQTGVYNQVVGSGNFVDANIAEIEVDLNASQEIQFLTVGMGAIQTAGITVLGWWEPAGK